jgi:hypothetical protein
MYNLTGRFQYLVDGEWLFEEELDIFIRKSTSKPTELHKADLNTIYEHLWCNQDPDVLGALMGVVNYLRNKEKAALEEPPPTEELKVTPLDKFLDTPFNRLNYDETDILIEAWYIFLLKKDLEAGNITLARKAIKQSLPTSWSWTDIKHDLIGEGDSSMTVREAISKLPEKDLTTLRVILFELLLLL